MACHSQVKTTVSPTEQYPRKYNTVIAIHLKKNSDRRFLSPGRYDPYRLSDDIIGAPPHMIDTASDNKTVIRLELLAPQLLTIGFSECFITPGDSLDMDFQTLVQTKYDYKDSTRINYGNVFFTLYNGGPTPRLEAYRNDLARALNRITTPYLLDDFLSEKHIQQLASAFTGIILKEFPNIKAEKKLTSEINDYCLINVTRYLVYDLRVYSKKAGKNPAMRKSIAANVDRMMATYYAQKGLIHSPEYWLTYARAYSFYKEAFQSDYNRIMGKFENYNDTIKQYIMVRCLKDGIIGSQQPAALVLDQFTYPPFREAAAKYLGDPNLGTAMSRNLTGSVRNTEIFDASDNKLRFFDIFKNTRQANILFDFCGTWCKPCMEEISVYSEKHALDNSATVRPVWLFFENDKSKWLAVIEKYKLPKENCFIVLDRDFINEFAKSFNWGQEFPHHFLFTKEGKLINENAPSMSEFEAGTLSGK